MKTLVDTTNKLSRYLLKDSEPVHIGGNYTSVGTNPMYFICFPFETIPEEKALNKLSEDRRASWPMTNISSLIYLLNAYPISKDNFSSISFGYIPLISYALNKESSLSLMKYPLLYSL